MLRSYQSELLKNTYDGWQSHRNVLACLPTGGGKTHVFSTIIEERGQPTMAIAHRQELLGQMSQALAEMSVPHRIIAPDNIVTEVVKTHRFVSDKMWYDPTSPVYVAGVDTLIQRHVSFPNIKLWVIDEAHHVLKENKWGRAVEMFPNARGLGVTATPERADGKGLGAHHDGVFHHLVQGPSGSDLIDMGYLSPYRVAYAPTHDLDLSRLETGKTGDVKHNQLSAATKRSRTLVGNTVETYLKHAAGKLGITFCVDIEHATKTADAYNEAGVPALLVTGKTGIYERAVSLDKFRNRKVLQLVNVDLFGEGFDVPGVEVVTMARYTNSFPLFSQQAGRALRPVYADNMPLDTDEQRRAAIAAGNKPFALILDQVGNVMERHGLPTVPRPHSLDRREKRAKSTELNREEKVTHCINPPCGMVYHAMLSKCPYCGHGRESSSTPKTTNIQEVDGDLYLIDESHLRDMAKEANRIIAPGHAPTGLPHHIQVSILKKHAARAAAQKELRDNIAQWGGWQKAQGLDIRESQRLFYLRFGVDVLTAQTLNEKESKELEDKINADIQRMVRTMGYTGSGSGRSGSILSAQS